MPGEVVVHGATNGAGERLWFVHNFGWDARRVTPPMAVVDVLSGEPTATLELEAWDVRVVREVVA